MAKDHGLGVGINHFSHALTASERYRGHLVIMANETQGGVAHHIYWLTAAETGYIGLAIYVALLARVALLAGWRGYAATGPEANLLIGFFFGFISLYLSGFLEWAMRITPVTYLFYLNCGVCVALAQRIGKQSTTIAHRARRAAAPLVWKNNQAAFQQS